MDIFAPEFDPSRDMPSTRKVEVPNGPAFLVERKDPYGFWYVRREHGQVPAKLQGAYTSFEKAELDINTYTTNEMRKPVDYQGTQTTDGDRPSRKQGRVVSQ